MREPERRCRPVPLGEMPPRVTLRTVLGLCWLLLSVGALSAQPSGHADRVSDETAELARMSALLDTRAAKEPSVTHADSMKAVAPTRFPSSRRFNLTEPNYFLFAFQNKSEKRSLDPFEYQRQIKFRVALRYHAVAIGQYDTGLHAAYTQNSFWHLWEPSAPFFDNNYNPQAILYLDSRHYRGDHWWRPSVRAFVEHESNGRDGQFSRGWNRYGAGVDFGNPDSSWFYSTVRAWDTFGVADDNRDLADYAGRGEVTMSWQPLVKRCAAGDGCGLGALGMSLKSRVAGKDPVMNVELNGYLGLGGYQTLRGQQPGKAVNVSLMGQYFHGRGENLLTYKERRSELRLGFATVQ